MNEQIPQIPNFKQIREKLKIYLVTNFGFSEEELANEDVFGIAYEKCMDPGELDKLMDSPVFKQEELPFIRTEMLKSGRQFTF